MSLPTKKSSVIFRQVSHSLQFSSSRRVFIRNSGFFFSGLALTGLMASCGSQDNNGSPTNQATGISGKPTANRKVRIGYQKSAANLNLLKNQGKLDARLKDLGGSAEWSEFSAGPQMLEALNVGSIDIAYTGETPPVVAQAAGAPLRYVAWEPVGGKAEAILVHQDSRLKTVADLKGKKVVLNKGSNVHYLLVKALEEAGLAYTDVQVSYLPPSEARPAFEQKRVDAWVIWDPFFAAAEKSLQARILRDGQGLVENRGFYLATQSFVESQTNLLEVFLGELKALNNWANTNTQDVVKFLAVELGLPEDVVALAESRRGYGLKAIDDAVVTYQQNIADVFYNLNLIPQKVDIANAVWRGA